MADHHASGAGVLIRTGDLIVAACAQHFDSICCSPLRVRIADYLQTIIHVLNEREGGRLLVLIANYLTSSDFWPERLTHGPAHLRVECVALVERLIVYAFDPDGQDLNTGCGRIRVALDKAARHQRRPPGHCIIVSCQSAYATIEQARQDGLLYRTEGEDVALSAAEWKWLFGHEVATHVKSVDRYQQNVGKPC